MANKYYALDRSNVASWLTSLKNALVDKYGDAATIHNHTSSALTFSVPAISEKVINFNANYAQLGTASGTTFTNQLSFFYSYSGYMHYHQHLILGDSFMMIVGTGYSSAREFCLIAKTVGGMSIFFGATSQSNSSYNSTCRNVAYKDDVSVGTINFVDFGRTVYSNAGVPYKMPLMIFNMSETGDQIYRLPTEEFDTVDGLWMSAFIPGTSYLRAGGLFSPADIYTSDAQVKLRTAILAEFE